MKTFKVELLAFENAPGNFREVEVPLNLLKDDDSDLDRIFHFGQNDFQLKELRSVSVGDVIYFQDQKYLICGVGFSMLTDEELEDHLKSTIEERIVLAMTNNKVSRLHSL